MMVTKGNQRPRAGTGLAQQFLPGSVASSVTMRSPRPTARAWRTAAAEAGPEQAGKARSLA